MTTRHSRGSVLATALILSLLPGFLATSHTEGQDDGLRRRTVAQRAAGARFHKLIFTQPGSAKKWYMIGDWCFGVADDLSPRSHVVFQTRGKECLAKAKRKVPNFPGRLLVTAKKKMKGLSSHAESRALGDHAAKTANSFLLELLAILEQHQSQLQILTRLQRGLSELDHILEPLASNERCAKAGKDLVQVDGDFVR